MISPKCTREVGVQCTILQDSWSEYDSGVQCNLMPFSTSTPILVHESSESEASEANDPCYSQSKDESVSYVYYKVNGNVFCA